MNQPQQARTYTGHGANTATTYALVAATAALAALVGVAGALWLRHRQWGAATPPSSQDSGSPRGRQGDDNGNDDADGDEHAEREEGCASV